MLLLLRQYARMAASLSTDSQLTLALLTASHADLASQGGQHHQRYPADVLREWWRQLMCSCFT